MTYSSIPRVLLSNTYQISVIVIYNQTWFHSALVDEFNTLDDLDRNESWLESLDSLWDTKWEICLSLGSTRNQDIKKNTNSMEIYRDKRDARNLAMKIHQIEKIRLFPLPSTLLCKDPLFFSLRLARVLICYLLYFNHILFHN